MKTKHFFISVYGWTYWLPILVAGALSMATLGIIAQASESVLAWGLFALTGAATFAGLAFFRDFHRAIPQDRGVMVAPADGKVTEITRIEHVPAFNGPGLRVGIFLSVLDVHVNRSPCEGVVIGMEYKEGLFLDARHTDSGLKNQSNTIVLGSVQAGDHHAVAVVKQIVGAIARRIISPVRVGDKLERGERFGMIAFGSRTELYVPHPEEWEVAVRVGDHVTGGKQILLRGKARG